VFAYSTHIELSLPEPAYASSVTLLGSCPSMTPGLRSLSPCQVTTCSRQKTAGIAGDSRDALQTSLSLSRGAPEPSLPPSKSEPMHLDEVGPSVASEWQAAGNDYQLAAFGKTELKHRGLQR